MAKAKKPIGQLPPSSYTREFQKRIEHLSSGSRHTYRIFSDWLKCAAICCHQEPYHQNLCPIDSEFERLEAQYMATIKGYSRAELDIFTELFSITYLALQDRKHDFLGQTYMQLELGNSHAGQYFSPYEVSLLMAKMTISNTDSIIQEKGFLSVQEPACGAGGMLIAVAQVLEERGHGVQTMFFDATDIAEDAANMCYVQCAMLGMFGVVHYGNSLSREFWDHRITPNCRAHARWTNYMLATMHEPSKQIEASNNTPTTIAQAPTPAQPALFDFDLQPTTTPNSQRQQPGKQRPKVSDAIQQPLF
jgi:hypothetical protein